MSNENESHLNRIETRIDQKNVGENMDTVLVAETGENMANIYSSVLEIKILVCGQDSPLVADSKENIGLGFQARC